MAEKKLLGKIDVSGYETWFKYVDKQGNVYAVQRSARSFGKKKSA